MQKELDAAKTGVEIRILGVNHIGEESTNDLMTDGRTIPWLQDTAADSVWDLWNIIYRDVVILDEGNIPVAVYNLTLHDLGKPNNYDCLKSILTDLANP